MTCRTRITGKNATNKWSTPRIRISAMLAYSNMTDGVSRERKTRAT